MLKKNTATATVTALIPSNPTDDGTTYTVKAIIDSTTPAEVTANFVVSKPADVTRITLSESQIKVGTAEYVTATITGKNFDIRGVTQVKLFDASSNEVTTSTVTVPLENNTSNTEFTVEIPVPTVDSVYKVAVFFDDVKFETTSALQVYGVPQITSVSIPIAGGSYAGNTLPVTIKGKNFTSPGITASSFSGTSGITNFNVVSDTKATAEVMCPYVAGTTNVTVNCAEASGNATLKVVAAENCFNVGDILFTDGTRIKAENVQYGIPDSQMDKAFAVIASAPYGGGVGKAVGLQTSSNSLQWAPSGTTGYNTKFTEIQAGYSNYDYDVFTGDLDGSDNWAYICSIDPEGTADAATNYPAFNFALNYGETAGLTGTKYETGWYIPSVAELDDVCTNKEVQTSLTAAGGFTISTSTYWSSSQYASYCNYAYRLYYVGYMEYDIFYKDGNSDVLVVQAFNGEQFNDYEYDEPSITSVTIPTAGEGYTGELPVTIEGTNLKGHAITSSDTSFSNVTYVSDTKVTATITFNGVAGTTNVKVNCAEASGSAKLKVLAAEKCFNVGDIILTDGSKVSVNDVTNYVIDENNKPIGVIASTPYGGVIGKAVGLQKSSSLRWAPSGTTGYNTNFEGIQANKSGSTSSGYTFTGDLDGSDNWAYICSIDPEGTADAATNYPAFNFAVKYGETAGLTETEYETGWYIPSVAELYDVYTNKEVVQTSLTAAGGFTLGESYYWSSSQYASNYDYAFEVDFSDGYVYNYFKYSNNDVLVLQAFNAE